MDKPYRIGIDARFFGTKRSTGIGLCVEELIHHLVQVDQDNHYTVMLPPEVAEVFPFYADNLKKLAVRFPHYTYSEQLFMPKFLQRQNFDLIHYTNFNSPILFRATKSVVSVYDLTLWYFPGRRQRSWFRHMVYRYVIRKSCENAERIIAISEGTKADIVKHLGISPDKIDVIYAAPAKRYRPIEDAKFVEMIRSKHNISRPFFLYVGQWRAHKNVVRMIRAFALVRRRYNLDYQLVLVGKVDELAPEVLDTIRKLNLQSDVVTTGYVADDELPYFYTAAEAFVFPSLYEGFGIPPLEAMAAGTPVVSSNVSVMPEVLGDAAHYFDPTNVEEMAAAMHKVATNFTLKKQLVERGFAQARKYSFTKMAKEVLKVYQKILSSK